MQFVVSGRVTPDVGLSSGKLAKEFEREIDAQLPEAKLLSPLASIVLFPTILNPDIASMQDKLTYKKRESSVYVSRNMSHPKWMESSELERVDLLAENIASSLQSINNLLPEDKLKLLLFVENARRAIREKIAIAHGT